jgi:hypothetical protein
MIWNSKADWHRDCNVWEIGLKAKDKVITVGGFDTFDAFGDRGFCLLDSPGVSLHLCNQTTEHLND